MEEGNDAIWCPIYIDGVRLYAIKIHGTGIFIYLLTLHEWLKGLNLW